MKAKWFQVIKCFEKLLQIRAFPYWFVFLSSFLVTSLFLFLLPESWRSNESSDYIYLYEPLARNLVAGNGYVDVDSSNTLATYYPPGYPAILALLFFISKLFSISEGLVLTGFIVISSALSVVIVYEIAARFTNIKSGILASFLWMTYPFFLWLTKQPNSEIIFMVFLLSACMLLFSTACFQKTRQAPYFFSGVLLGIAILIRPIAVFFPVILLISVFYSLGNLSFVKKGLLAIIFLAGVLLPILPWEGLVYAKTGKIVLISENSSAAMRGGLVFALAADDYKQVVSVPEDVEILMREVQDDYDNFDTTGKIVSFLRTKIVEAPLTVIKLFGIKAVRSWYATDRQSYENYILVLQIPYLLLMLFGSFLAWKRKEHSRRLAVAIWLLTLCNWGMTMMVTSTLRYMVPVIGLQFILSAQIPYFFMSKRNSNI